MEYYFFHFGLEKLVTFQDRKCQKKYWKISGMQFFTLWNTISFNFALENLVTFQDRKWQKKFLEWYFLLCGILFLSFWSRKTDHLPGQKVPEKILKNFWNAIFYFVEYYFFHFGLEKLITFQDRKCQKKSWKISGMRFFTLWNTISFILV